MASQSDSSQNDRDRIRRIIVWRCAVRIRLRRRQLGLSQSTLAARAGLTVRRVAQCEKGRSGLSAGDLYCVAAVLRLSVTDLLDSDPLAMEIDVLLSEDPEKRREAEHLLSALQAIQPPDVRDHLLDLIEITSHSDCYSG
jgi:transcriptional regulator with XRE-family HTH domain